MWISSQSHRLRRASRQEEGEEEMRKVKGFYNGRCMNCGTVIRSRNLDTFTKLLKNHFGTCEELR
jgi:hypothetical protein